MRPPEASRFLFDLYNRTNALIETAQNTFLPLPMKDFFKRPDENKWSIAENLGHLNIYNKVYLKRISRQVARAIKSSSVPEQFYTTGYLGNIMINSMQPSESGKYLMKIKTLSAFEPEVGESQNQIVTEFISQQEALQRVIEKSKQVNLNLVRVSSITDNFVKLSLGDALHFIVVHNERHVSQAGVIEHTFNRTGGNQ